MRHELQARGGFRPLMHLFPGAGERDGVGGRMGIADRHGPMAAAAIMPQCHRGSNCHRCPSGCGAEACLWRDACLSASHMPRLTAETPEGLRLIPWSGLDVQMRAFVQSRQYQDALHT